MRPGLVRLILAKLRNETLQIGQQRESALLEGLKWELLRSSGNKRLLLKPFGLSKSRRGLGELFRRRDLELELFLGGSRLQFLVRRAVSLVM